MSEVNKSLQNKIDFQRRLRKEPMAEPSSILALSQALGQSGQSVPPMTAEGGESGASSGRSPLRGSFGDVIIKGGKLSTTQLLVIGGTVIVALLIAIPPKRGKKK